MRNSLLILFLLMMTQAVFAQKLTVESMVMAGNDISASKYERKDLNGTACALLKVMLFLHILLLLDLLSMSTLLYIFELLLLHLHSLP